MYHSPFTHAKLHATTCACNHDRAALQMYAHEVWNLTIKMLGPMRAPRLNAKAKETHGLLPFCLKLLEKYRMKLKADGPDFVKKADLLEAAGFRTIDEPLVDFRSVICI